MSLYALLKKLAVKAAYLLLITKCKPQKYCSDKVRTKAKILFKIFVYTFYLQNIEALAHDIPTIVALRPLKGGFTAA